MKKIISLFVTAVLTFQLCCIATVFADSVTDDFDNADSWSVNIPEIYENGGESYAHLKHTSAMKAFTQYKFTPPSNSAEGKFVVEARVKNPSASMSLMTVYLKNVSTSAVQLRSQYTSLNDGYMWRNLKGDKPVSKIKTDIIPERPDFTTGWDTIYMVFDTENGTADVYFNGPNVKYTSAIDTNSGGLDCITFSVRKDLATEADAGMFLDYVSIYPYEDTFTPPDLGLNEKFIDEDFERYDIGDNAFKGFIGYGPSNTDYRARVVTDPANPENKCLMLENLTATTKNIASDLGYENLHYEFKAYMPDNVYAQFPKFRSASKDVVFGSTDTLGKYNVNGGGSAPFDRNGWNDFEFDFDGANANIKINGEKITVPCEAGKIDCVLFGLWENTAPIYIDDLLVYENDGQPVIRADKKGGTVKYGDKIYLNSNVSGADIYYTLDGTEPDETSNLYDGNGIAITDNDVVIKAYGVNGGVSGRVFTFGSYTLEAEDGVIFIPVNFSESASSLDAEFSFINTEGSKNVCVILGMYGKDGTLLGSAYEENLLLENGRTSKTLTVEFHENTSADGLVFKAYVWSDMISFAPCTSAVIYENGTVSYESAPSFEYDGFASVPIVTRYRINNEEKTIALEGNMQSVVKNQDITFAVFDKNQNLIALEQKYVNSDKEFSLNAKFDASDTAGGALKAYVGARKNTTAVYLDSGYYVDDAENKNLTAQLNAETSSTALIERMKEYSRLNIIGIDFENHKLYNENKADSERILLCSKNKENFKSLSDAEDAFEKACASAKVINSADKKYFDEILNNTDVLNYASEENYKISDIENFDKYNEEFDYLLSKEDLTLFTNQKAEKIYKTTYAICSINSAEKSEITDIAEKYNDDVFGLDLEGDYAKVSAYEVAKALYEKNFKTPDEVKTAFDKRVEYLVNNISESDTGRSPSSGGGGSSNKVKVNTPTNIVPGQNGGNEQIFDDVGKNHWAFDYISELYGKKIISGYGNGTFNPDGTVTRAEFLKMTASAFDLKQTGDEISFKDVSQNDWFADFIITAVQNGLALGFDGYIRPNDSITRQETAVIIARALNKNMSEFSETSFADNGEISDYAKSAVGYLAEKGIIKGYDGNMFVPFKNLTRAEAAKILCTALGL